MIWIVGRPPEGARPKVGPRFSTQTIAEGVQGSQGGTDFYLPLLGQPRISEVACMEGTCGALNRGNPGIYIQADEWQETYGGNVFVVDEVTGRMYVLRGDALERIPEVASRRRREEPSLSVTPRVPREGTGSHTPTIGNTPIPVAESHSTATEQLWQGHPDKDRGGNDPPRSRGRKGRTTKSMPHHGRP